MKDALVGSGAEHDLPAAKTRRAIDCGWQTFLQNDCGVVVPGGLNEQAAVLSDHGTGQRRNFSEVIGYGVINLTKRCCNKRGVKVVRLGALRNAARLSDPPPKVINGDALMRPPLLGYSIRPRKDTN